jgi:hypothetical protein
MFASSSRSDFQKIIGVIDHGFWISLTVVVANPVATEAGEGDDEKAQKVRRSRPSFAGKGIIKTSLLIPWIFHQAFPYPCLCRERSVMGRNERLSSSLFL